MNVPDLIRQLTKRKTVLIAAGAALLLLFAFFLLRANGNRPEYRTEPAMRGDITAAVTATGIVNPVTKVLVGTQVSGIIKDIFVDYNSPVRKGQLIALIDPASFQAQVEQARANLSAAKAELAKARAAFADAERTRRRNRELYDKNLIAESEVDTADTNYETTQAQVNAAEAGVAQAGAALRIAETNLRYSRIVSPVDGVVISRNVDRGQTVAASFQTPTLFVIAQDLTKMQINTSVGEADIGAVKVGQEVEFTVDAYPDRTFAGKVQQVRIEPVTVQNVVTYDAVIFVDNKELLLKPGMTANVSIITARKSDVLKIPNTALRFRPQGRAGAPSDQKGPGVWVLEGGAPKRVAITLGVTDGTFTEIASGDLKEDDAVIVSRVSNEQRQQAPRGPRMF
jgi:HlyD family secretion protein